MHRVAINALVLAILTAAGAVGLWRYASYRSAAAEIEKRDREIRRLQEQQQRLERFVARLTSERRAAEVIVTEQVTEAGRVQSTTLLFQEYDRARQPLGPPRFFTVKGAGAHIDAKVIKFDRGFLRDDDPLRGHSIVLFYRIFGDHQTPADGFYIDKPGEVPGAYTDPTLSAEARAFEAELWANFWKLADDPAYRASKGVRVASPQSVWRDFSPDMIYEITLEADGGLNIIPRPIDGIWRAYRQSLSRPR